MRGFLEGGFSIRGLADRFIDLAQLAVRIRVDRFQFQRLQKSLDGFIVMSDAFLNNSESDVDRRQLVIQIDRGLAAILRGGNPSRILGVAILAPIGFTQSSVCQRVLTIERGRLLK